MSDGFSVVAPVTTGETKTVTTPVIAPEEAPGATLATPAPEQVRAAEAAFRQDAPAHDGAGSDEEARLVSGLLGLWTGTLLLHDLALEHFWTPADERARRPGLPRDDEDGEADGSAK